MSNIETDQISASHKILAVEDSLEVVVDMLSLIEGLSLRGGEPEPRGGLDRVEALGLYRAAAYAKERIEGIKEDLGLARGSGDGDL